MGQFSAFAVIDITQYKQHIIQHTEYRFSVTREGADEVKTTSSNRLDVYLSRRLVTSIALPQQLAELPLEKLLEREDVIRALERNEQLDTSD